jgi:probable rRNA maturation factor
MINILVNDPFSDLINTAKLELSALAVLQHEGDTSDTDLTIVIEDDARLQALNKEFLSIDAPTDVLSFPSGGGEFDPETGRAYLGDVIISYQRAVEQADAAGHPLISELQLLVVHGVLHLLGYDHAEADEKEAMWFTQAAILGSLGVQISRLPE